MPCSPVVSQISYVIVHTLLIRLLPVPSELLLDCFVADLQQLGCSTEVGVILWLVQGLRRGCRRFLAA